MLARASAPTDQRSATRVLTSLRAELTRRQRQLAAAGADARSDYLRKATIDPNLPPFPRLIVVVDELAELKQYLPEMVDGLLEVARVGRSMGVHLILATQRPAGVVDAQIRANVDLRICLRTMDEGDSFDMIEVGDAARIPKDRPGRALVRRGGPAPEMVQSARISTPYNDGAGPPARIVPISWRTSTELPYVGSPHGSQTDLQALVGTVAEAARRDGLAAPHSVWAPPLPNVVLLADLPAKSGRILLGLNDRPAEQSQTPYEITLGTGHVGIIGSSRTGRTSALRAIAAALARANPPSDIHVHVIDGSGGLAGLAVLPHVGVVAGTEDTKLVERLLSRLTDEVRLRRGAMSIRGAATSAELGWDAPPALVLLVDGWQDAFEGDGAGPTMFRELLPGAASAGLTVCIASDERMLRTGTLSGLEHRFSLRLNSPADATLLGLSAHNLPDRLPGGRLIAASDGTEVQVPLLAADTSGTAQLAVLREIGAEQRRHFDQDSPRAPLRLQPLPIRMGFKEALELPRSGDGNILVGVTGDRHVGVYMRLGETSGHLVVAGPNRSGRSTALATVASSAARSGLTTVLVSPRMSEPVRAVTEYGVQIVTPMDVAAVLGGGKPDLVVIDDADLVHFDDQIVTALTGRNAPPLAVGGLIDAFGFGARGIMAAARRTPGASVLLSPPNHLAASNVGVSIDRGDGFTGPPGRAYVSIDGNVALCQVPDITARDWTPTVTRKPPFIPGFSDYSPVGGGGSADVYLARQEHLNRIVAVKVFRCTLADRSARKQYLAECEALARLGGHPSIIAVLSADVTVDGHPYLVMEAADCSLQQLIVIRGRLPFGMVETIGLSVAGALDFAHSRSVVHGDITPANILFRADGTPVLTDFGLAALMDRREGAAARFTLDFAAPETVRHGGGVDARTDVYGLGSTLFAALHGRPPFMRLGTESDAAMAARIASDDPPRRASRDRLDDVVDRMLAKDPARRPEPVTVVHVLVGANGCVPPGELVRSSSVPTYSQDVRTRSRPRQKLELALHDAPTGPRPDVPVDVGKVLASLGRSSCGFLDRERGVRRSAATTSSPGPPVRPAGGKGALSSTHRTVNLACSLATGAPTNPVSRADCSTGWKPNSDPAASSWTSTRSSWGSTSPPRSTRRSRSAG